MHRHVDGRFPRIAAGAWIACAMLVTGASAGTFGHAGMPQVSLDGRMTSAGGEVLECGGFGMDIPGASLPWSGTAEWYGSWPMAYPSFGGGSLIAIAGDHGATAEASFARSPVSITFSASLDRADREEVEARILASRASEPMDCGLGHVDCYMTGRGGVSLRSSLDGTTRFRLDEDSTVDVAGWVASSDAESAGLRYRAAVSWAIRRAGSASVEAQGGAEVDFADARGDRADERSTSVRLGAGEYELTCSFASGGTVDDCCCWHPGQQREAWSDAEQAGVTVRITGAVEGDLDGNGCVDMGDMAMLLLEFGTEGGPADIDGNGSVDSGDIGSLLVLFSC